jgi:hypothetical protein
MKTAMLWVFSLFVALCAVSWVVLAFMVQPLDGLLTASHPTTIEWVLAAWPVMLMSLFSCVLFFIVLKSYRFWMALYEYEMTHVSPPPPTTKPRTRRKRYQALNPWPALEDDE